MTFGDALAVYRKTACRGCFAKAPKQSNTVKNGSRPLLKSWPGLEKTDVRKIFKG